MSAPFRFRSVAIKAYAKINLGLQVLGKRADGYHELLTVLQTVSMHDDILVSAVSGRLTLEVLVEDPGSVSGWTDPAVPSGPRNLAWKAAAAFAKATGVRQGPRIRLLKRIPAGAGLGGGSSDAAGVLAALNRLHGFPLGAEALHEVASALGSDVPFFLRGGTALGLGRGEILRPLRDMLPCWVVILMPGFGVSTAEAYGRIAGALTPKRGQISIYRFSRQGFREKPAFEPAPNDLERAVLPLHPEIRRLARALEEAGAIAAAMTGSGSAVYGLFAGRSDAYRAWRNLTGEPPVERAWLARTVGAAEHSARFLKAGAPRVRHGT